MLYFLANIWTNFQAQYMGFKVSQTIMFDDIIVYVYQGSSPIPDLDISEGRLPLKST